MILCNSELNATTTFADVETIFSWFNSRRCIQLQLCEVKLYNNNKMNEFTFRAVVTLTVLKKRTNLQQGLSNIVLSSSSSEFVHGGWRFSHPVHHRLLFSQPPACKFTFLSSQLHSSRISRVSSPSFSIWYPFQKSLWPTFFNLHMSIPNKSFSINSIYNIMIKMHPSANLFILDRLQPRNTTRSFPEICFQRFYLFYLFLLIPQVSEP